MQINVSVTDANNIVCEVVPPQQQIVVIDRGVEGNGIVSIVPVTISTFQYLRITYTNGTVQDVGPLTSTAYTATSPITIVGNTISLTTVPIALGGTDATTAAGAIQNLLPSYTGNGGKRLGLNSGATALEWVTDGGGTVTSVAASGGTTGLSFTGSPITTSGTLTLGGTLAIANGGTGQTTANAALNALLPTQTGNASKYLQTDGTNATWDAISLSTADITGILPTTNGGTGLSSFTANRVLYTSSTSAIGQSDNLTFDGTNLRVGTTTFVGSEKLTVAGAFAVSDGSYPFAQIRLGTNLSVFESLGQYQDLEVGAAGANGSTIFKAFGSEKMRLNSTGLGIGTNSPTQLLDVVKAGSDAVARVSTSGAGTAGAYLNLNTVTSGFSGVQLENNGTGAWYVGSYGTSAFQFTSGTKDSGTELMRLTTAGNLGIGTNSPAYKLDVNGTAAFAGSTVFNGNVNTFKNTGELQWKDTTGTAQNVLFMFSDNNVYLSSPVASSSLIFRGVGYAERARIDSAGNFGIGTSSPAYKLDVAGTVNVVNGSNGRINIGATNNYLYGDSSGNFIVGTSGSDKLLLNSSGNLGLATTPSAWGVNFNAAQVNLACIVNDNNNGNALFGTNFYYSGASTGTPIHIGAGSYAASQFSANLDGSFNWKTGSVGTTGTTITWTQAMTLDSSGNLGIGTSGNLNYGARLKVYAPSNQYAAEFYGNGSNFASTIVLANDSSLAAIGSVTNSLLFYTNGINEKARIDGSGNLLVGLTSSPSNATGQLSVKGDVGVSIAFAGNDRFTDGSRSIAYYGLTRGGTSSFYSGAFDVNLSAYGGLGFYTEGGLRARIDTSGNMGIGTASPTTRLGVVTPVSGTVAQFNTVTDTSASTAIAIGGYSTNYDATSGTHIRAYTNHGATGESALAFEVNGTSEKVRIDTNGNMGIGTSNPIVRADIINNATYQLRLATGANQNYVNGGLYLGALGTSDPWYYGYMRWDQGDICLKIGSQHGNGTGGIVFLTAGGTAGQSERMRITYNGEVGIGTTNPGQKLDVSSGDSVTRISITNTANAANGSGVQFLVKNGATIVSNATIRSDNADNIQFFNMGGERARIDTSGKFHIGNTGDQGVLSVYGGTAGYTQRNNDQSGRMLGRNYGNYGTGSRTLDIMTVTGWQSGNSRIFGTVTVYSTNAVGDAGNKTEAFFFANQAGSTNVGSMVALYTYGGMSVGSLSWSGLTLRFVTPADVYAFGSIDIQWAAGDGAYVSYNT